MFCRKETGIQFFPPCVTDERRREGEQQVTHFCLSDWHVTFIIPLCQMPEILMSLQNIFLFSWIQQYSDNASSVCDCLSQPLPPRDLDEVWVILALKLLQHFFNWKILLNWMHHQHGCPCIKEREAKQWAPFLKPTLKPRKTIISQNVKRPYFSVSRNLSWRTWPIFVSEPLILGFLNYK